MSNKVLIISLIRCIIGTHIPRTISVKKEILRASLSNKAAFCESDFPLDTTAPFVFCALPCLGIYNLHCLPDLFFLSREQTRTSCTI